MDALTFREVREILDIIDQSNAAEVKLDFGETQVHVKRRVAGAPAAAPAQTPAVAAPAPSADKPQAPASAPAPTAAEGPEGCVAIKAPLAGVFYRAPAPDAPPFVDVGQVITATTDVCIIEAMKVMNTVKSGIAGEVVEIARANEEPVEYHAPVIWVRPSDA